MGLLRRWRLRKQLGKMETALRARIRESREYRPVETARRFFEEKRPPPQAYIHAEDGLGWWVHETVDRTGEEWRRRIPR